MNCQIILKKLLIIVLRKSIYKEKDMDIKIGKKLLIENELIGIRKSIEKIDSYLVELEKEGKDVEEELELVLEDRYDRINLFEDLNELLKNYFLWS